MDKEKFEVRLIGRALIKASFAFCNEICIMSAELCLARYCRQLAAEVGYLGMRADEDDAEESVRAVVAIREVVRVILGGA